MTHCLDSWLASTRAHFARFRDDKRGNVAPVFAITLIPVMASIGTAVDYSHANRIKTAMQAAADATALNLGRNAASLPTGDVSPQATQAFNALYTRADANSVVVTAQATSGGVVSVQVTGSMPTSFMGIMGVSGMTVGARASAVKTPAVGNACVLALDRTAAGATTGQGSTTVNLNGCSLYDNSGNASALTVGGSARITALSVGVVGGISGNASITTTQGVMTGVAPITDPYRNISVPFYSGCDQNSFTAKNKVTINPGVYCGGMQFNANADVTFNPGVYFVDRGTFQVNGGAALQGTGVTIIFTSSTMSDWPTATINGGATISLIPPTTGPTAGIVMYGDRNMPVGTSYKLNGGAGQYLGGAVYFPKGNVDFAGGAGTSTNCTQLIADTVTFTGNSGLAINCTGYAIKPIGPTGLRLTS